MNPWLAALLAATGGYLFGSINFALLFARAKRVDLRGQGSGNPGATNAGRVMGRWTGVVVALLDIAKGYLPAILAVAIWGDAYGAIAGVAAILGHITSPFAGFRGGKGVATAGGVVLALRPLWALPVIVVFGLVFLLTKRVGIASVAGALTLIPTALLLRERPYDVILAVGVAVLIAVRHQRNLREAFTSSE
ncbi:MAG: glycerol-3-phosphate 1-O-acyltransferase PlsY [Actinobacteria bacterium]|nr:glycerol-3-phosphate 1-O-acyltransferase PlsY [Actinomycetota bacterium]MCB9413275.1 glycerol-3-phosphate 1-O-acyltransferase PlsY [Actinomycetota bacterium]